MNDTAVAAPARLPLPARLKRVLPHGVMLVGAVLLYWAATRIDAYTGSGGGGTRIGPDAWPKAILVIMGLLCAFEVVKRWLAPADVTAAAAGDGAAAVTMAPPPAPAPVEHPRKLWGGIALVTAYVLGVAWLGFFVSTALFLAAFPWVGGLRRPALAAALGLGGSFLLVVLFMRVAYISLPLGEGPFRALSLALLRLIGVSS